MDYVNTIENNEMWNKCTRHNPQLNGNLEKPQWTTASSLQRGHLALLAVMQLAHGLNKMHIIQIQP